MSLKRKYTVTISHPQKADTQQQVDAESMKTIDVNVILMDFNEESCTFEEVAFFTAPSGGNLNVVSQPI